MFKSGELGLVCLLFLQWTVFAPFMTYYWWKNWQLVDNFFLRKRFTQFLLIERGLVTFDMLIVVSVRIGAQFLDGSSKTDEYILSVFRVIYQYAMWVGIARIWLCYYDLQLRKATTKQEWSALITRNQEMSNISMMSVPSTEIMSDTEVEMESIEMSAPEQDDFSDSIPPNSNESDVLTTDNWFIRNWDTLGNSKMIIKYSMVIATLFAMIDFSMIVASFIKGSGVTCKMTLNVSLFTVLISNLMPLIIFFMIPPVADFIYLRDEIKYLVLIKSMCVILFIIADAMADIYLNHKGTMILIISIADAAAMLDTYVSFVWVIEKLKSDGLLTAKSNGDLMKRQSSSDVFGIQPSVPRQTSTSHVSQSSRSNGSSLNILGQSRAQILSALISDNEGFQILMAHLMEEFSEECLVSVVEFVQFKQYIASILQSSDQCVECMELNPKLHTAECLCPSLMRHLHFSSMIFPECVPPSGIVFYNTTRASQVSSFNQRAHYIAECLFAKFLASHARLQINVSFQTTLQVRMELDKLVPPFMNDGSNNNNNVSSEMIGQSPHTVLSERLHLLFHVFDQSINEMIKLMIHSLSRFVLTAQFDQWAKTRGGIFESELNSSILSMNSI